MDNNQEVFREFEVPDPARIAKAADLVRKHFGGKASGLDVLECGVTKGGMADTLRKEGAHCFGVDIHPRSVEGVEIRQMDLNEGLPDFGVAFDVIFAGEVMEHLFDDRAFLERCRAKLKDGGLLVLTVPNLLFSLNRIWMLFGKMPVFFAYASYHYHMYNKKTLENLLGGSGFTVAGFRSSHVLFSTRRGKIGKIFELLGDAFPSWGAHLIVAARKK